MKIRNLMSLSLLLAVPAVCGAKALPDYVNTLMGTDSVHSFSHGNTYPAVAVPWGMNFWSPQTGENNSGWMYVYGEDSIRGFRQTHQPSPWINDYAKFSLMPMSGELVTDQHKRAAKFSHKNEVARPYYYGVTFDNGIKTEIAPADHAAAFKFTFAEKGKSYVVIDTLKSKSSVKIIPEQNRIIGYVTNHSGGRNDVPENFANYFVIEFETPIAEYGTWNADKSSIGNDSLEGDKVGAWVLFNTDKTGKEVVARVASSFISVEQAERNLKEVAGKSFKQVKEEAFNIWDKELGRIQVKGGTEKDKETFYSCLYRTLLFPRKFYEINAEGKPYYYSPYDGKIHDGYMFTDNGFWDTFRAVHPFFTLMYPELSGQIMQGLVATYEQSKFLPEWASPGHRGCMIGNNSFSLIADAYMKGIRNFDVKKAVEAMVYSSTNQGPHASVGRHGHVEYFQLGYVPYAADNESTKRVLFNESTAKTLEYAYNDWCLSIVAADIGNKEVASKYLETSKNYKNVYDPSVGFMRGRNKDGSWLKDFDPTEWGGPFTEGCSWHYTWSVFHDTQSLIDLMGGREKFVQKLDDVFTATNQFKVGTYGGPIHEMVEMTALNMGQYAHGNQPIQHMIYLYGHGGEPWKAQKWVRQVLDKVYKPTPDGYCGDEDNGQTSAWFVMSAMGFYSVTPGEPEYVLGSPLFEKVTMKMPNGKEFVIEAKKNNDKNVYIKNAKLNGKDYTKNFIRHDDFVKGGSMVFEMSDKPNTARGTKPEDLPFSYSNSIKKEAKK